MNSCAIYRISKTIRVLFFMTLSILIFNFYPVTAVMIVLLALLNDGPILAIAYDNVCYANRPESWGMRTVLGMSTVLGMTAVYGWFMVPIGWQWALVIWGYALAWFFVNDLIKLGAYHILDPTRSVLTTRK